MAARLRQFTRETIAGARFWPSIMCLAARTMRRWIAGETKPNGGALALFEVLESSKEVRHRMGIMRREPGASRGRPFRRGNQWRFGDRRRKETMHRVSRSLARFGELAVRRQVG